MYTKPAIGNQDLQSPAHILGNFMIIHKKSLSVIFYDNESVHT